MHLRAHIFTRFQGEHDPRPPSLDYVSVVKSYGCAACTGIYLLLRLNLKS